MERKLLFFSDLDNTLIYSHRHADGRPVVWVEQLEGRPQSFMTLPTYRFLQSAAWLPTVPLTTRTEAQYRRLQPLAGELRWRDALLCNGAVLLRDGEEDLDWRRESEEISKDDRPALERALSFAVSAFGEDRIQRTDPFFFYVKGGEAEMALQMLQPRVDPGHLRLTRDARKVYCYPQSLQKGTALRRYAAMAGASRTIAAGDSAFDIPMLEAADLSFYPQALAAAVRCPRGIPCQDGIFSDQICAGLNDIWKQGRNA